MWFNKLSEFIDEDISEWEYTVEVPNQRKDMVWCVNRGIIVIETLVVFLAFSYNKADIVLLHLAFSCDEGGYDVLGYHSFCRLCRIRI